MSMTKNFEGLDKTFNVESEIVSKEPDSNLQKIETLEFKVFLCIYL